MEYKTSPNFLVKATEQGVVECIFSVFGVLDAGDDIVHNGAFSETFRRHKSKIRILDNHRTDSLDAVVGKPVTLKEVGLADLPYDIRQEFPEATGGAFARIQFLMSTESGRGTFERVKAGLLAWSFGYDTLKFDYSEVTRRDGTKARARNLRKLRCYEISPVLWPMQEAVRTVSAKSHRRRLDPLVELELLRMDLERLEFGGKTRTQLLAEILLEQDEIAELLQG